MPLVCDIKEGDVAAMQIFPIMKHLEYRIPTIKHHCPCTEAAAARRNCSNQVSADPGMVDELRLYAKNIFFPKLLQDISGQVVKVSLKDYINKFEPNRRNRLLKLSESYENWDDNKIDIMGGFAKIEMQFTKTLWYQLHDKENDVKERMIVSPDDLKKIWANAFINAVELLLGKCCSWYSGADNWPELASKLQEMDCRGGVWVAADGSGFDMTQYAWANQLMNDIFLQIFDSHEVEHDLKIEKTMVRKCLEASLLLDVKTNVVSYKVEGRASGDGWTSCGNTILNALYWHFTAYRVGVELRGSKFKSDDSLQLLADSDIERWKASVDQVFTHKKDKHTHGLGQICKMMIFGTIEEVEYLSCHFFYQKGKLRVVRIPARVVQTNSFSTKVPLNASYKTKEKYRKALLYSKGKCLEAWGGDLPIWRVLCKKMIELGKFDSRIRDYDVYADGPRVWHAKTSDHEDYYRYLERRFGLTVTEVRRIEKALSTITTMNGSINIPELDKLYYEVDDH